MFPGVADASDVVDEPAVPVESEPDTEDRASVDADPEPLEVDPDVDSELPAVDADFDSEPEDADPDEPADPDVSATAMAGTARIADPMPSATANAPIRPT